MALCKIALYSEIGRQDIVACRQFIKENNYGNTADDIRACRKHIMSLPEEHPVKQITRHGDFFTISTCARPDFSYSRNIDLLFQN